MSLDKNIQDVLQLQDVELANAMNNMRSQPGKLNDFIAQRKQELQDKVTQQHSDNFQKVQGDLVRAGDTVKNITQYHVRNKDLDELQEAVFDRSKGEADAAQFDSQVARRQFEMNEWTAGNKMDTLFFLQLLAISLLLLVPVFQASRMGLVPSSVVQGLSTLLTIAIILTFVLRQQYTDKSRDYRFWNRRRFAGMGGPPAIPTCPSIQPLDQTLANVQASAQGAVTSARQTATQITQPLMKEMMG